MSGETNLQKLLQTMQPKHNTGEYVFCTIEFLHLIDNTKVVCFFKETEGYTIIIDKAIADEKQLSYTAVFSWITLTVHSSLEAVGLTAAISTALSSNGISCNVVAAYYHDHIFVPVKDAEKAMSVLEALVSK
ncbi:MAG: ACT domain-containing protein [Ferruginibacter sp.]|nr:ACT domain-containing protein [Ferruginibacter sp.]